MSANGSGKTKKRSKPGDQPATAAAAGGAATTASGAAEAAADAKTKDSKTPTKAKAAAATNAEMTDADQVDGRKTKKQSRNKQATASDKPAGLEPESLEDLEFEDENPDDVDSEDEQILEKIQTMQVQGKKIGDAADSDDDEDAVARAEQLKQTGTLPRKQKKAAAAATAASASGSGAAAMDAGEADADEDEDDDDDAASKRVAATKVWRPADGLAEGEQLEYDAKFYSCYHALRADWPCLSFDILRDRMGELRTKWPATLYMVTGTQAERGHDNKILVMKVSDIHRTKHDHDDPEDDDGDDDDANDDDHTDDDPLLATHTIDCDGGVNRIRAMPQLSNFVASWHDTGKVHIWNVAAQLASLDKHGPATKKIPTQPVFTFQHTFEEKTVAKGRGGAAQAVRTVRKPIEGFALDWSGVSAGRLATGDHKSGLYVWEYRESSWAVDGNSFKGHTGSVEDIQWSPNEANVFATCSTDRTIRIWDTRQSNKQSIRFVVGHKEDVNVISWNKKTPAFLVSGSDDHSVKVWDFRKFTSNSAIAQFKFHRQPVTSVEWHPHEDSVFAASSSDGSISVWDLALERDADFKAEGAAIDEKEYPPQLYFVHQGQTNTKEVHFHPQCPALMLSTAEDGFNIFKPANMELTQQQLQLLAQPYKQPTATAAGSAAAPPSAAAQAAAAQAAAASAATATNAKKA